MLTAVAHQHRDIYRRGDALARTSVTSAVLEYKPPKNLAVPVGVEIHPGPPGRRSLPQHGPTPYSNIANPSFLSLTGFSLMSWRSVGIFRSRRFTVPVKEGGMAEF